jgi:glucose repression regulatory protein TUP1
MFKGHEGTVYSVDFSPDGRFLVSGSHDRSVRIWRMRDGSARKLLDSDMSFVYYTSLSPDGRHVAAGDADGVVRIWDFRSGQLLEKWNAMEAELLEKWNATETAELLSVVFTSDGKGLLSGGEDNILRFWDVSSLTANPSSSRTRRGAVDDGNINEEKIISTFRGHAVRDFCTCFVPELIFLFIGWCLFCFRLA